MQCNPTDTEVLVDSKEDGSESNAQRLDHKEDRHAREKHHIHNRVGLLGATFQMDDREKGVQYWEDYNKEGQCQSATR